MVPALFASALLASVAATGTSPSFHADPVARPAETRIALRDTLWRCGESGCSGTASSSRPAVVCAVLAREVGPLRSFSVKGAALSPDDLARCNARARKLGPERTQPGATR